MALTEREQEELARRLARVEAVWRAASILGVIAAAVIYLRPFCASWASADLCAAPFGAGAHGDWISGWTLGAFIAVVLYHILRDVLDAQERAARRTSDDTAPQSPAEAETETDSDAPLLPEERLFVRFTNVAGLIIRGFGVIGVVLLVWRLSSDTDDEIWQDAAFQLWALAAFCAYTVYGVLKARIVRAMRAAYAVEAGA